MLQCHSVLYATHPLSKHLKSGWRLPPDIETKKKSDGIQQTATDCNYVDG